MNEHLNNNDEFNVYFEKNLYNIKKFMKHHPGGTNSLLSKGNKEISNLMSAYDHSDYAYYLLSQYKSKEEPQKNGLSQNKNGIHQNGNGIIPNEERKKMIEKMEKIESLVDWSKPMLGQIHKLGPYYAEWVHNPVDKELRMFESPILESFTFTLWYFVPLFWVPIISFGTYYTYNNTVLCAEKCDRPSLTSSQYLNIFIFGAFMWTLIEYSIHRWVFHYKPGKAVIWKQLHFLIHGLHHKVPFDELRLVFPPIPALFLISILYCILTQIYSNSDVLTLGITTGYLIYDMIHYFIHNSSPKDGSYMYAMKRYHASHHFKEPFQGFGISSKIWDVLFDTTIRMKKIDFSLSWK